MTDFPGTTQRFFNHMLAGRIEATHVDFIGSGFSSYSRSIYIARQVNSVHHGNSLTRDSTTSDEVTMSYPARLKALLGASQASHPNQRYNVIRRGTGSITTPSLQALFSTEVHAFYNPGLVNIVHLNEIGNHIAQGFSKTAVIDGVKAYNANARALGWKIALHLPPPRASTTDAGYSGSASAWDSAAKRNMWSEVCAFFRDDRSSFDFLVDWPVYPLLSDPKNLTYYTVDGVHNTDSGALAKALATYEQILTWF